MKKLKVAIICHVSNKEIRSHISLNDFTLRKIVKKIFGKSTFYRDDSLWNTLMLKQLEEHPEIEVHAIIPHRDMLHKRQNFEMNGIFYHCFKADFELFPYSLWTQRKSVFKQFTHNNNEIINIVQEIRPDFIHMIGAEAPFFNLCGLKIDVDKIPFLISLQTVMSDPNYTSLCSVKKRTFDSGSQCEQALFKHCRYFATSAHWYREIVKHYNANAIFVNFHFCAPTFKIKQVEKKEYDFVYWAANINKAGMDALEAFSLAHKENPSLTLHMVGGYTNEYKQKIDYRLSELGIKDDVSFSGYLPTHFEALKEVSKARYALVPIKLDIISSTIREAMILGLPIVTYVTHGTPSLNRFRKTALLSEIGDYQHMAQNMCELARKPELARSLINNGYLYCKENLDNTVGVNNLVKTYYAIYEHFNFNVEIPHELCESSI